MVDATLTRGSGNFLSSGSTILTLPNIDSEVIKKSAGLIRVPFPITDSDSSIMADLLGVSRDINVSGQVSISDVTDIYKFARDLASIKTINTNTLVTGDQSNTGASQVGYIYTPVSLNIQADGTLISAKDLITVYINDVQVTYVKGSPNLLAYSLTMFEGSSTNSF